MRLTLDILRGFDADQGMAPFNSAPRVKYTSRAWLVRTNMRFFRETPFRFQMIPCIATNYEEGIRTINRRKGIQQKKYNNNNNKYLSARESPGYLNVQSLHGRFKVSDKRRSWIMITIDHSSNFFQTIAQLLCIVIA